MLIRLKFVNFASYNKIYMKRLLFLFILLLSALAAVNVNAQKIQLYTSDGELSSGLVNKVMQDSNGFLWIATENGLNQFDGLRFKTFYKDNGRNNSLLSNYVHTVAEMRDGRILVGCINGLMQYEPKSDSFIEYDMVYNGSKVKAHISDMLELTSGEFLIATAGYGIFALNQNERKAHYLDNLSKLVGDKFVSCLYEDSAHTVWIGTEKNGLCRYYPSSDKARNYRKPEISGNIVNSFVEDAGGNIIVGSLDGGVDCYDKLLEKFTPIHTSVNNVLPVISLCNADGKTYACTDGFGTYEVMGNHLVPEDFGVPAFAKDPNMKVHQVLSDRDGNIWISIFQKGVILLRQNEYKFNNIGTSQNLWSGTLEKCVMAVSVDKHNRLWVSRDNNGGIDCYDSDGTHIAHFPTSVTVMAFMPDSKGRVWAGTYAKGVYILDRDHHWQPVKGLENRKIYTMQESLDGNIYVGSLDRGLECYDPQSGSVADCLNYLNANNDSGGGNNPSSVNRLCLAKNGKLWVAHYNGISCYDCKNKKFDIFDGDVNLIDDCIGYAVHEDKQGLLWFGTSEGLYRYDSKTNDLIHFTVESGLPNNVVGGICQDKEGNIWVSTYHGIAMLSSDLRKFYSYDAGDGLQGNEFTHGAYFTDEYGVIYFGGINGVTSFHPSDIRPKSDEHSPLITEVGVYSPSADDGGGVYNVVLANSSGDDKITLPASENTIDIYFSTLSYENPSKTQFEYRIKQSGDKWISTAKGQNKVTFYNLAPGTYDFQIRLSGSPDKVTSLKIVVLPPWYLSWWAITIYILVSAAIIFMLIRNLLLRKKQKKEIELQRQSEKLSEAKLELFTNISHDIRTPMTLIIDPMRKLIANCSDKSLLPQYNVIYRNAWRIMALVNQLMDIRKFDNGQMRMRARATDMVGFIEDVMKTFELYAKEHNIVFHFRHEMERQECWIDLEHFDKVMMNLISNAFKHTMDNGEIDITLSKSTELDAFGIEREMLEIEVKDSGEGIKETDFDRIFEPFFQSKVKVNEVNSGTGIGLHLSKLIVNMHSGRIDAMNRLDRSGAIFRVTIPLGKSHLKQDQLLTEENKNRELKRTPLILNDKVENIGEKSGNRINATIIVVEDDNEIRGYLHSILSSHYRKVVTYSNAEDAYKDIIMMSEAPELVISDVMLDGMDGLSFTKKLRQNARTNHIPVILVSAKSDLDDIKKGIDSGADHYIVKPFSSEILMSTIYNVMSNRHLLKVKFSGNQEQEERLERIKMDSSDEVLMQKVMNIINRNLSSTDFSVEKLADEIGISRAHLHRKLKELTNLSTRDFIRSIRMKQAANLLKENKFSIAEVAYATGYANPSHFSNVFKEYHGVTPTQYMNTPDTPLPQSEP